jgi:hypothetical protein
MIRKKRFGFETDYNDKQEIVSRSRFWLPGVSVPFFATCSATEVMMGSMVVMKKILEMSGNGSAVGVLLSCRWKTVVMPRF